MKYAILKSACVVQKINWLLYNEHQDNQAISEATRPQQHIPTLHDYWNGKRDLIICASVG